MLPIGWGLYRFWNWINWIDESTPVSYGQWQLMDDLIILIPLCVFPCKFFILLNKSIGCFFSPIANAFYECCSHNLFVFVALGFKSSSYPMSKHWFCSVAKGYHPALAEASVYCYLFSKVSKAQFCSLYTPKRLLAFWLRNLWFLMNSSGPIDAVLLLASV